MKGKKWKSACSILCLPQFTNSDQSMIFVAFSVRWWTLRLATNSRQITNVKKVSTISDIFFFQSSPLNWLFSEFTDLHTCIVHTHRIQPYTMRVGGRPFSRQSPLSHISSPLTTFPIYQQKDELDLVLWKLTVFTPTSITLRQTMVSSIKKERRYQNKCDPWSFVISWLSIIVTAIYIYIYPG